MIQIRKSDGKFEITFDEIFENKDDLLNDLSKVLCFIIIVYKMEFEKIQKRKLSRGDEDAIDKRIKDSIAIVPLDDVRVYVYPNHMEL